jgi:hypothetical protein
LFFCVGDRGSESGAKSLFLAKRARVQLMLLVFWFEIWVLRDVYRLRRGRALGTRYCGLCSCEVDNCVKPRHRSRFCSKHNRLVTSLPLHLQLIREAAPVQHLLMPSDVVDFADTWPQLLAHTQEHLALAVLHAWIKLPSSRSVFFCF